MQEKIIFDDFLRIFIQITKMYKIHKNVLWLSRMKTKTQDFFLGRIERQEKGEEEKVVVLDKIMTVV